MAGVGGVGIGMDEGKGNDNEMRCNFMSFSCSYSQVTAEQTNQCRTQSILHGLLIMSVASSDSFALMGGIILVWLRKSDAI